MRLRAGLPVLGIRALGLWAHCIGALCIGALCIGTLFLCTATLSADVVHLNGGKKLRGTAVEEGNEVVVNPYNSRVPGMTFGVTRVSKDKVKRIEYTRAP